MPAKRIYPYEATCAVCGATFLKTRKRHLNCSWECSMRALTEQIEQTHAKAGPRYEHWRAGMKGWAEKL